MPKGRKKKRTHYPPPFSVGRPYGHFRQGARPNGNHFWFVQNIFWLSTSSFFFPSFLRTQPKACVRLNQTDTLLCLGIEFFDFAIFLDVVLDL